MPSPHTPRGEQRLVYHADTGLHACNVWRPVEAGQFARHIDAFADHGVDIFSWLTFPAAR